MRRATVVLGVVVAFGVYPAVAQSGTSNTLARPQVESQVVRTQVLRTQVVRPQFVRQVVRPGVVRAAVVRQGVAPNRASSFSRQILRFLR